MSRSGRDRRTTVFLSGSGRPWRRPRSFIAWANGLVSSLGSWFLRHLPKLWIQWACDKSGVQIGNELLADMKVAPTYQTGQTVAKELAKDPSDNTRNWRGLNKNVMTRTCVVAVAEKDCLERGKQLRKGNPESMAFKVDGKRHA